MIMMLSSGDQTDDVARCDTLGIAAYLTKPVKQSDLFDAMALALKIAEPGAAAAPADNTAQRSTLGPLRVLLAEDSLVNQKLAVALLTARGHEVTIVGNGREAVAAAAHEKFDLVLMDVQMPEMDGLEAAATIRGRERLHGGHLPIIAMTAHALKGDRELCLQAGMDDYVPKPIRAEQLFETIASVCAATAEAAAREGQQAGSQAVAIVDWPAALQAVEGNREALQTMIEAALEEVPQLLATIRLELDAGDAAALRRAAHTLKASIGYFSHGPAFEEARQLELIGQENRLADASAVFVALEGHAEEMLAELQGRQWATA
jgi:CheY-like chemotaxis protein